ncbi:MAG TPA: hypothetical protein VEG61_00555, partial [Candidatus Dormibacteraeota bacterium]|nr:hypothetical protein [Candidatus Dormibacteraeota bacterium]
TLSNVNIHGCFTGNKIDKEANYFDQMVYNPWDLVQAANKRWSTSVEYFGSSGAITTLRPFLNVPDTSVGTLTSQWSFKPTSQPGWDSYGSFAERVLGVVHSGSNAKAADNGSPDNLILLVRNKDYSLTGCTTSSVVLPYTPANTCTGVSVSNGHGASEFKIIYTVDTAAPGAINDPRFGFPFGLSAPAIPTWEWVVVGRITSGDSDAISAALITEALAGTFHVTRESALDTADTNNPTIPFLLTNFGTTSPACPNNPYAEDSPLAISSFGSTAFEGCRARLRDDFSTIIPIDGSNILVVGGPLANGVTNLANDFLSAIFRPQANDLYSTGAWDQLSSTGVVFAENERRCTPTPSLAALGVPSQTTGACTFGSGLSPILNGFGVVSTYMDVDGTVYWVLYGGTAQDVFWLANFALQYVQTNGLKAGTVGLWTFGGLTPYGWHDVWAGSNSVIFQIDYTSNHPPQITFFKQLDTISEVFPEQDN